MQSLSFLTEELFNPFTSSSLIFVSRYIGHIHQYIRLGKVDAFVWRTKQFVPVQSVGESILTLSK